MRLNAWVLIAVLLGLGAAVYNIADRVQIKEKKLNKIDRHIASEQENIRVLTAEWTFLTNPDRLEKLTQSHFKLVPMDGSQYIALAAIPMRDAMDALENPVEDGAASAPQDQQVATTALPKALNNLPPLNITPVNATTGGGR